MNQHEVEVHFHNNLDHHHYQYHFLVYHHEKVQYQLNQTVHLYDQLHALKDHDDVYILLLVQLNDLQLRISEYLDVILNENFVF